MVREEEGKGREQMEMIIYMYMKQKYICETAPRSSLQRRQGEGEEG